jgi:hypothetical protein
MCDLSKFACACKKEEREKGGDLREFAACLFGSIGRVALRVTFL